MKDFGQKARLVAGFHMTKAPSTIIYATIVSRATVRIALMIAILNDLEVKLGNILSGYNRQQSQRRCGPLVVQRSVLMPERL